MQSHLAQPQAQAAALAALADLMVEDEVDATVMTGVFLEKDQFLLQKKTGTGIKANGKKAVLNRMIILEAGGLEAVLSAMIAHASDQAVQEAGCQLFCNLVYEEEESICERVFKIGGIERVLVALKLRQGGWEGQVSFQKSESEFAKAGLQTLARLWRCAVGRGGGGGDNSTQGANTGRVGK
jgi:hypothetical protein